MTDHIDQLLHLIEQLRDRLQASEADAAEWKQACSGRTVSCGQCNELARQIEDLKQQMQQRDCIACNSFLTGNGWCDRHRAMLVNGKP